MPVAMRTSSLVRILVAPKLNNDCSLAMAPYEYMSIRIIIYCKRWLPAKIRLPEADFGLKRPLAIHHNPTAQNLPPSLVYRCSLIRAADMASAPAPMEVVVDEPAGGAGHAPTPEPPVTRRIQTQDGRTLCLSIITKDERLKVGACKVGSKHILLSCVRVRAHSSTAPS
jgi:hypothetical protein